MISVCMNQRLVKLINKYGNKIKHGTYLNCYNGTISSIASTIMVGISFRNLYFVAVGDDMELKKELCNKLTEETTEPMNR